MFRRNRTESQAWLLAVIQHLQLAIEIYSGDPVRIEHLTTRLLKTFIDKDGFQNRRIEFEAVVSSKNFTNANRIKITGRFDLEDVSYAWHVQPASPWHFYLVGNRKGEFNEREQKQYSVTFTYDCSSFLMPLAEVHEVNRAVVDEAYDPRWRTGRHLGDREIHPPEYRG
jgi:hypothetical protein